MMSNSELFSRRTALKSISSGFGYLAFAALADQQARAEKKTSAGAPGPLAAREPHFAARAKRVIWLFMAGAPSQIDTLDYQQYHCENAIKKLLMYRLE